MRGGLGPRPRARGLHRFKLIDEHFKPGTHLGAGSMPGLLPVSRKSGQASAILAGT